MYHNFTESSNSLHLISLACIFAHLHLNLLFERYHHGKEMYEEDNTDEWLKELNEKYTEYHLHFCAIYPKWKVWRDGQVEARWYTTSHFMPIPPFVAWAAHGVTTDHLTNKSVEYKREMCMVDTLYMNECLAIQTRMRNEGASKMITSTMTSTFLLNAYLPDHPKPDVDPALSTFWLGPFSPSTIGLDETASFTTDVEDTPGEIKQILVREYNSIDALQFIYTNHEGNLTGNPNGGEPHYIDVKSGTHFTGSKMRFAKGLICMIEFLFSDGSGTGNLGNRGGWSGIDVDATVDPSYKLAGGKFKKGYGPSSTTGTGVIELLFKNAQ